MSYQELSRIIGEILPRPYNIEEECETIIPLSTVFSICDVSSNTVYTDPDFVPLPLHEFIHRQLTISKLLGGPLVYKDGKSYWNSRRIWKKHQRRNSLNSWTRNNTLLHDKETPTKKVSFNVTIDIHLIPPKEGEDFDIDETTKETFPYYEILHAPLQKEENYKELWSVSPFQHDNGKLRPFFYDIYGTGPSYWCHCQKIPNKKYGRKISCNFCLNNELRKFARKSTPEQFREKYLTTLRE